MSVNRFRGYTNLQFRVLKTYMFLFPYHPPPPPPRKWRGIVVTMYTATNIGLQSTGPNIVTVYTLLRKTQPHVTTECATQPGDCWSDCDQRRDAAQEQTADTVCGGFGRYVQYHII
jgi:hypothetical protein